MIYIKTNELFKEFFKFLKENNAYVQYRTNICHDGLGNHFRKNNIPKTNEKKKNLWT